MILSLLEAKVSDIELVDAIKQGDKRFSPLRDSTVAEVINLYKKDTDDAEPTAEKVLVWLADYNDLADFAFLNSANITTYSTSDLAENDEKLAAAIRKVLRDWEVIDEDDVDLTGTSKKLNLHQMCTILFDNMPEVAKVQKGEREEIPQWSYELVAALENPSTTAEAQERVTAMSEEEQKQFAHYAELIKEYNKVSKDKDIRDASFAAIEDAYHQLFEDLNKCPECGHCPCICEAKEEESDQPAEEEQSIEVEAEVSAEIPEEATEPESEAENLPAPSLDQAAFHQLLSTLVQSEWNFIDDLHAALSMLDSEELQGIDNKDSIQKILNDVINDSTINVGMIYKAMEIVSNKTSALIADGIAKAEETID